MKKTVLITMAETDVTIAINSEIDSARVILPFSLVSPQTALHIASALSQDATISKPSGESDPVSE